MQLLVLILVLGVIVHDEAAAYITALPVGDLHLASLLILPKIILAILYGMACHLALRRLGTTRGSGTLKRLDKFSNFFRLAAFAFYGMDLYFGGLIRLRETVGNLVLLDEVIFMVPTLAMMGWQWWCYYPIDRRLREAALIGRLDAGLPIHPIWTRLQYLIAQFRHQVALILAPLLVLLAWRESVEIFMPATWELLGGIDPRPMFLILGSGCVFLLAPVMIRHIWDTVPLPDGELRERLLALCRQHRVGIRQLLLWRTFGGMINAAVMGLVSPLRYILLTDALLEMVPARQVEAVMAHEIAHVRRHHMFWLLFAAAGSLGLLEVTWTLSLESLAARVPQLQNIKAAETLIAFAAMCGAVGCWILVFGFVSRRFERQADTFAVQHLTRQRSLEAGVDTGVTVDGESAQEMIDALGSVAALNHMSPLRRSWRHGSIHWRQEYLRTLVGQPIDRLSIDREVYWIKVGAALSIAALIALQWWALSSQALML